MLTIYLLLFGVSSKIIKFEQSNYTKEELLEKVKRIDIQYGNDFITLITTSCEMIIKSYYPNISIYFCAFYMYECNRMVTAINRFTYNETIEIEDSIRLNSMCLDCRTLNYFERYIEPPEDDCY